MMRDHASAVSEFVGAGRRFPGGAWTQALAHGKWSPAEITSHVAEAYDVLRRELSGEPGMQLLGSPLQRWLLRRTMLPRILRGRRLPGTMASRPRIGDIRCSWRSAPPPAVAGGVWRSFMESPVALLSHPNNRTT